MRTTPTLRLALLSIACLYLLAATSTLAQPQPPAHILANPEDAHWRPTSMLPAGIQIATLTGDPTQPGPFAVRIKFPAHFAIPAHWHPADDPRLTKPAPPSK